MNRPSPPPEATKVLEAALDVFVYAPIGFLLDAREVVPKLAERGRGQVTLARMFGRYALQLGQAEAERVLNRQRRDDPTASDSAPQEATAAATSADAATESDLVSAAEVATTADLASAGDIDAPEVTSSVLVESTPPEETEATVESTPPVESVVPVERMVPVDGGLADTSPAEPADVLEPATPADARAAVDQVPSADELPIPGYDSLSASQVVPRLEALLPQELEAVRAYETAHRGRRTILNRIAQRLA